MMLICIALRGSVGCSLGFFFHFRRGGAKRGHGRDGIERLGRAAEKAWWRRDHAAARISGIMNSSLGLGSWVLGLAFAPRGRRASYKVKEIFAAIIAGC
jgi:hypothetical protein